MRQFFDNYVFPALPDNTIAFLWLASIFVCVPVIEWDDMFVLILAFTVVGFAGLAIWLAGVPLWFLAKAAIQFYRRRRQEALRSLMVLPLGIFVGFVGLKCGDLIAIMTYGPELKRLVTAVRSGAPAKSSDGVFSSSTMAFRLTGGFLDMSNGIVYDSSGLAGTMLPLPPSQRPKAWQENAVDVMTCKGRARHLFGDFYSVSVSTYSC